MHTIVIENEHVKNKVYAIYDLMGQPVRPQQGRARIARFLHTYHFMRDFDMHDDL
jgi:hypothetical protein